MDRIRLEGVELDLERRRVVHADGRTASLTELEAGLLRYLAARPGILVTKEQLLREVWGYAPGVQSRAVDYTVRRLRKKLEDDPRAPVHLVGVYGGRLGLEGVRRAGGVTDNKNVQGDTVPACPLDAFVGRRSTLDRLRSTLADGARLVVILGPGGAGKTRLLLEACARHAPSPVAWADLTGIEDADALHARIAGRRGGPALVERPGWLVLDGVDRAIDLLRERVPRWLQANPRLQLLLSSRQRPGILGEQPLWLPPLGRDAAVRLFEGRAAAAGALQRPDDPQVGELVGLLGGLPLAIELAAVRAGVRTVAALAGDLARPLEALREPGADGRSLRQVLTASFVLLPEEERSVLARCAVLPGRFARGHAEAVAGPHAVEVLDRLRQRSLVRAHPGAQRAFELELGVRALALEDLPERERRAAESALVDRVDRRLDGAVLGLLPRGWVRDELPLLRMLHDRARPGSAPATRLAVVMAPLLAEQGHAAEALARLGAVPPQSMAGVVRGRMLGELGRHEEAVDGLQQAILDECGHVRGWARVDLARLLLMQGHPDRAAALLVQGQAELAAAGDTRGVAIALLQRALAQRFQGRLTEALSLARASERIWQQLQDPVGQAICDVDTALLLRLVGQQPAARRRLKRALPVFEAHGAVRRAARAQTALGVLSAEQGDRQLAEQHHLAALALYRRTGNRRGEATARINLGSIATQRGRFGVAESHLLDARDLADELGLPMLAALALGGHGMVRFFQGRPMEALRELETAARALHGRAFVHNAAWCMTYAGVLRLLAGLPPAEGLAHAEGLAPAEDLSSAEGPGGHGNLPPPASPALLGVARALAAGDRAEAADRLAKLPPEDIESDDGRALFTWLQLRVREG